MISLRQLSLLAVVVATAISTTTATPPNGPRSLRTQHNGEDHGAQAMGGGGGGAQNPGGILGPLYAAFPGLLAPLAMASDTIHNTNAAVSGVQHTPDGIFQA